ncbi:hypothetical protein BSKO_01176 [Bryopsis sp. KO-2023]|nr:hypothetical protein BSKO_01176 [Bryopsis sp. KO-2023]
MQPFAAIFVASFLAAGVSCEWSHASKVDFLDVDALSDGVHSSANVEWFQKNAQGPHGLDCDSACKGFGSETECKGLHVTTCSGVQTCEKGSVHSKMVWTCLGSFTFSQNATDDRLDMATACHGLFGSHTFAGVTKNVTTLPENCHGHCSKHHEGSHCSEHCPKKCHHSNFDAIVKAEAACGLQHSWTLAHPFGKGSSVSMHSTCGGVSSFGLTVYGKKEVAANEDLEAAFDREVASIDSMDSNTILEKLSSIAAMSTSPVKESEFLDTIPLANKEDMNVTCNGKTVPPEAPCEGEFKVVRAGDEHGGQFVEEGICKGKEVFAHNAFVCEGTLTNDRTDTTKEGKVKVANSVCEGKHLFSMFSKDAHGGHVCGFMTVCVGDGVYDSTTTPPAEGDSDEKPATTVEPISKPEVTPDVDEPPSKPVRKTIHVPIFKNKRIAIV